MEDCIFCKIVAGEIPGEVVHATERTVAFRDLNPQAPTHVLVVPRRHFANAAELAAGDPEASAELLTTAAAVAADEGHDDYRLVFNTGAGSSTVCSGVRSRWAGIHRSWVLDASGDAPLSRL